MEVKKSSQKTLEKFYYDEGITLGRDGLFHYIKTRMPQNHPTKREINAWLKQQEIQQLYAQTRTGGYNQLFQTYDTLGKHFYRFNRLYQ